MRDADWPDIQHQPWSFDGPSKPIKSIRPWIAAHAASIAADLLAFLWLFAIDSGLTHSGRCKSPVSLDLIVSGPCVPSDRMSHCIQAMGRLSASRGCVGHDGGFIDF